MLVIKLNSQDGEFKETLCLLYFFMCRIQEFAYPLTAAILKLQS